MGDTDERVVLASQAMFTSVPSEPLYLGLKFQIRVEDFQATGLLERRCPRCATVTRLAP